MHYPQHVTSQWRHDTSTLADHNRLSTPYEGSDHPWIATGSENLDSRLQHPRADSTAAAYRTATKVPTVISIQKGSIVPMEAVLDAVVGSGATPLVVACPGRQNRN